MQLKKYFKAIAVIALVEVADVTKVVAVAVVGFTEVIEVVLVTKLIANFVVIMVLIVGVGVEVLNYFLPVISILLLNFILTPLPFFFFFIHAFFQIVYDCQVIPFL